jgi:hypothetical protein
VLLQIPTQGSTHMVVNLDCRPEEVRDLIIVGENKVSTAYSPSQKYRSRLRDINPHKFSEDIVRILHGLSLLDWL